MIIQTSLQRSLNYNPLGWFPVGLCDNAGPDGGHAHRLPGLLLQGQGGRRGVGGEGGGEGDGRERWIRGN